MKAVLVQMLKGYKRWISPLLPVSCRYVPTCSEYAMEAISIHGAVRGSVLALGRLLRCHPFVRGGYDPVPRSHSCCDDKISTTAHDAVR
ncbi:protein of unknown function DUF37 [Candidatus Koribacter versatilis Ellin345]|uniref:Putative membrane protein insertion efficiency factor n=1 Tax=Koribacter versatilis (strain Ellin345) TaxID=204669 RepID=YIDD_KORVE|nr:membrane protein insertion efficiency factor YidD [Candidatus Koribacter versatilis]Q1IV77.1 RecName: Full=Putative membrane protein insertion efficiency factor [Candidatus Koribacter versatilis Ellin345]ABF39223.1 protein of unknown function DUF37 [Candidatus Koribacter versatilis Ellin345]